MHLLQELSKHTLRRAVELQKKETKACGQQRQVMQVRNTTWSKTANQYLVIAMQTVTANCFSLRACSSAESPVRKAANDVSGARNVHNQVLATEETYHITWQSIKLYMREREDGTPQEALS